MYHKLRRDLGEVQNVSFNKEFERHVKAIGKERIRFSRKFETHVKAIIKKRIRSSFRRLDLGERQVG